VGAGHDVLALNPVTFNWIDPTQPTSTQLGFIAQQVQKLVPEIVTTNPSTTMKAVDYARVTPLLVGAIQQQQTQIDAQNSKIDDQQKEIDELGAEVAALKAAR
jgi:transaldolase